MSEGLKPYPAYRESGVAWLGAVPAHWSVRRNGRLFSQRTETGFGELPILEVSLRTGVRVRELTTARRKQLMADRDKYKRAAEGDITYNMMRMWQGALGLAPCDGLVSPAYVVARAHADVVAPYYAHLFRTPDYLREIDTYSRGIVADRNRLYWESFKQIASPWPSYAEQQAIVRYLDAANRRIRRYVRAKQRLIALLEEQKRLVVHRAVTRGLDPDAPLKSSGVEWLGDVPTHWQIHKLSRLARIGNGSTPARTNAAYWLGGTHPWLNSGSVNESPVTRASDFVTDLALHECHLPNVRAGSVLVAITGQGKTRGTSAVLRMDATVNQHLAYLAPRGGGCTADYLHLALQGAYRVLRALSEDAGSTKGAITCESLGRFSIAVPPPDEQRTIVDHVARATRTASAAVAAASRDIALVTEYRTRLVADVVTGKLDVRAAAARLPNEAAEPDTSPSDDADAIDEDLTEDAPDLEPAEA